MEPRTRTCRAAIGRLTAAATSPNLVIAKISTAGTVCLHTHTARPAQLQESYFQLAATASANGMLYADPDGTTDPNGSMFWNATNSCCDLFHSGVDDSAYIASIIADVKSTVAVDPKRIFVVGHSNGGFMAYRMACNHAGDIAAIVSLAGATYRPAMSNSGRCPVAVTSRVCSPRLSPLRSSRSWSPIRDPDNQRSLRTPKVRSRVLRVHGSPATRVQGDVGRASTESP